MASGSNVFTNVTNSLAAGTNSVKNAATNAMNSVSSIFPLSTPIANSTTSANTNMSTNSNSYNSRTGVNYGLLIFTGLLVLLTILVTAYSREVYEGYEYIINRIRNYFGYSTETSVISGVQPTKGDITELTRPPRAVNPRQEEEENESLVERVLPPPSVSKEVFNVSKNAYTYYDAEPLCKALGAELATYDQVKAAWDRGADWCNYGWVKGQMAVFPTQKSTYDSLQNGPADQQGACGTVGINGGHFDNPELQYGVNCYGKKPINKVQGPTGPPLTPDVIKFNKKVEQYSDEASITQIAAFNSKKWSGDP